MHSAQFDTTSTTTTKNIDLFFWKANLGQKSTKKTQNGMDFKHFTITRKKCIYIFRIRHKRRTNGMDSELRNKKNELKKKKFVVG